MIPEVGLCVCGTCIMLVPDFHVHALRYYLFIYLVGTVHINKHLQQLPQQ